MRGGKQKNGPLWKPVTEVNFQDACWKRLHPYIKSSRLQISSVSIDWFIE